MIIVKEYPPNIDKIKKVLPIRDNAVFTYGDTLYHPGGGYIDDALLAHEQTHVTQQKREGPDSWWDKYLADVSFRLTQEIEAYRAQYKVIKKNSTGQSKQLMRIAGDLSSPMYGSLIDFGKALSLIRKP